MPRISAANFLFLKHYLRPTMSYLLTARPQLAQAGKRYLYAQLYTHLYELGRQVGYADHVLRPSLHFLFYLMAYAGKSAGQLVEADLQAFEQAMRAYQPPPGHAFSRRLCSEHLYRLRILLFQAGILPEEPLRFRPRPARSRAVLWAYIPQAISQVVWRYLDQLGTVRTLDTVQNHEGCLRRFFTWLSQTQPEVQQLRQLNRSQIEAFKLWLQKTPCTLLKLPWKTSSDAGRYSSFISSLRIPSVSIKQGIYIETVIARAVIDEAKTSEEA